MSTIGSRPRQNNVALSNALGLTRRFFNFLAVAPVLTGYFFENAATQADPPRGASVNERVLDSSQREDGDIYSSRPDNFQSCFGFAILRGSGIRRDQVPGHCAPEGMLVAKCLQQLM